MANTWMSKAKLNCFNKRQWKALVLAFESYAAEQNVLESESQTDKAKLSDLINVPFVEYVHDKVFRAFHSHITELATLSRKANKNAKMTHYNYLHDDKMSEGNDLNVANNTTLTKSPVPAIPQEQEERQAISKYISMLLQFLFSNKEYKCNSTSTENSPFWAELDLRPLTENEIKLLALCYRTHIKMQAYYNRLVSSNTKLHGTNNYCYGDCHNSTNTATLLDLYEDNKNELEKVNGIEEESDQRKRGKDKKNKTNKFSKQEVKHGYSSKVDNQLLENRTSNIHSDDKHFITDVDDAAESTMETSEKKIMEEDFTRKTEVDRHKSDTTHNMFQSDVHQEQPICQVCYESGGDLYLCSQCKRWMHEICGGPHPPEANSSLSNSRNAKNATNKKYEEEVMHSKSGNYNSLTNLCKQCRVEMRITSSSSSSSESAEEEECESTSSLTEKKLQTKRDAKKKKEKRKRRSDSQSSSSLRSTTSSSERAELEAYFGTDDDSDTSLSGFIVRSSEDEDNEEEEELEQQQHRQGSQSEEDKRVDGMHNEARKYDFENRKQWKKNRNKRVRDAMSTVQTHLSSSSSSLSSIAPLSTQSYLEIADDIL